MYKKTFMKKNFIYKIRLVTFLLLFFSFYLKSENCTCKKNCEANAMQNINIMQEANTPATDGVAPYYPFFIEI